MGSFCNFDPFLGPHDPFSRIFECHPCFLYQMLSSHNVVVWAIRSYQIRPVDFNSGVVCKFWPFLGPHFADLWSPKHIHSVIHIQTAKHIMWGIKSYQMRPVDFNSGVVCKFWPFLGPHFADLWSLKHIHSVIHIKTAKHIMLGIKSYQILPVDFKSEVVFNTPLCGLRSFDHF